ncbi:hypothetical protein RJZ90_007040 [Blastomyces dermatitidis]
MAASEVEYSVEREIDEFFKKTSATRAACDSYAKEHLGGDVISVAVQGVCSYTVYTRPKAEFVVQFRLKLLMLEMETAPQNVDEISREHLLHQYERELQLLLHSLPGRFHPFIRESLNSLRSILSLPMVLLHKDFGVCNIMVDEVSCNLVGVIDWAEAEIAPFGLNLHSHQRLISKVHLKNGWIRYNDYILLEDIFWSTFREEAGGLSDETIRIIKSARVVGLLLSCGFTPRLVNMPEPVPIQEDESEAYNMRNLDGLLINPATRFTELDDYAR